VTGFRWNRKPLTQFAQRSRRCNACWSILRRSRYLKDRERVLEQQRASYAAHREEICADKKAWRQANPQEYYRRNRDKLLEYGRRYREDKRRK
jgi:hypothetical protein